MYSVWAAPYEVHDEIVKLARLSPFTRDFSNHMFSGEEAYKKGWIGMTRHHGSPNNINGFVCVRHCSNRPYTSLYFIGVMENAKGTGISDALLNWVIDHTPHKQIRLGCMNDNMEGNNFYTKHGFTTVGEKYKGKGKEWVLEW